MPLRIFAMLKEIGKKIILGDKEDHVTLNKSKNNYNKKQLNDDDSTISKNPALINKINNYYM